MCVYKEVKSMNKAYNFRLYPNKDQIEKYAKSKKYKLEDLINNTDIQIDNIITRQLLLQLYKENPKL